MTEPSEPDVVATLEDDDGTRIVEILRHSDSEFTYIEYHLAREEEDEWQQVDDVDAKTYKTQFAAYSAAMRNVEWLLD